MEDMTDVLSSSSMFNLMPTAGALHAALLVLAAFLHTAHAATVVVSTTSQLVTALAHPAATDIVVTAPALSALPEGGLQVNRSVTLRGASTSSGGRVEITGVGVLIRVGAGGTLEAAGLSVAKAAVAQASPVVVEGRATFADCEFLANAAGGVAGAISSTGSLTLLRCSFVNNANTDTTSDVAGAVSSNGGDLTVVNCTFQGNTAMYGGALAVLGGKATVTDSNFTGNVADNDGGAINVGRGARLVLKQSSFTQNDATFNGGAISTDGELRVDNCTFERNGNTQGALYGGALSSTPSSNVTLSNSAFHGSSATRGGAVYNVGNLTATSCNFTNSKAMDGGGAFYVSGEVGTEMTLTNCRITENAAEHNGGGLQLDGNTAAVSLSGCSFRRNRAATGSGGAIYNKLFNLSIDSSTFADNFAYTSGGAILSAVRAVIKHCTFRTNAAETQLGGAIANLLVLDVQGTTFADNTALGGGGIWNSGTVASLQGSSYTVTALADGNLAQVTDCRFLRNIATDAGGGILHGAGNLNVSGSYFQDNTAATLGGGGLYAGGYETYRFCQQGLTLITNSTFVSNDAIYGGGAFVQGEACVYTANATFVECNFTSNSATSGGAVYAACKSGVCASYLECYFSGNRAVGGAGGAIYSSLPPNMTCPASANSSNSSTGCASWAGNTAENGGYGDAVATPPVVLRAPVELYPSQASRQPLANFSASLFDAFNQLVRGGQYDGQVVSLSLTSASGTGQLQGAVTSAFYNGVANFSGVNVDDTPGNNVIHLYVNSSSSSLDITSSSSVSSSVLEVNSSVVVDIRRCVVGEVRSQDNRTCTVCAVPFFSWDPNNTACDGCPQHAICQSGAGVAPEDGYWHSAQQSAVFHQCPNPEACTYYNRTGIIVAAIIYNNYTTDVQCSEGYSGNLCGVCTEDYGLPGFPGGFVCRRCPAKGWIALYFILWVLSQVGLVAGLIHLHLAANDPATPLRQDRRTRLNGAARLKHVIHFFQVVSLASYIQYRWPPFVEYLFATMGTLTLTQSFLIPLECFTPSATLSPAYSINVFYAVLPFVAFAPFLVFWPLRYRYAYVAATSRKALAARGDDEDVEAADVDIDDVGGEIDDEKSSPASKQANEHKDDGVDARERGSEEDTSDDDACATLQGDAAASPGEEEESPAAGGGYLTSSRPSNSSVDAGKLWPVDPPDGSPPDVLVTLHVPATQRPNSIVADKGQFTAGALSRSTTMASAAGVDQRRTFKLGEYLRERYALSAACTALLIWPAVVSNIISLFACRRIDHDTIDDPYYQNAVAQGYYWQQDLNEQCFEGTHLKHVLIVGVPGLLFYCLLIPGGVFCWLWHKRRLLDNARLVSALGVLYQQYRLKWFFWDGVLLLQKYLLITNSILLNKFGAQLQISIAFAIILLSVTIQWHVEPLTTRRLNSMHAQLNYTATATVWFGMVYFLGLSASVTTVVSVLLGVFCLLPAVLISVTVLTGRLQDARKLSPRRAHAEDGNNNIIPARLYRAYKGKSIMK